MKVVPTNKQVVSNFFGKQITSYHSSYSNVSFTRDVFFSYNTAIAQKVDGRNGGMVLLLSSTRHSNTTSKHITLLRCACGYPIIWVPTVRNEQSIDVDNVITKLMDRLIELKEGKLSNKRTRAEFHGITLTLREINTYIKDIDVPKSLMEL